MTSRSNLNTLRQLFTWNSTWYNKNFYKQLVFRDLVIEVYLTSLFYKLRIPTSYFLIKNLYFEFYIIETDLYVLKKKKIAYLFLNYTNLFHWAHNIFYLSKKYYTSLKIKLSNNIFINLFNYISLSVIYIFLTFYNINKKLLLFYNMPIVYSVTYMLIIQYYSSIKSNFFFFTNTNLFYKKNIQTIPISNTKFINNRLLGIFLYYTRTLTFNSKIYSFAGLSLWVSNWSFMLLLQSIFKKSTYKFRGNIILYYRLKFIFSEFSKSYLSKSSVYRLWSLKHFFSILLVIQKQMFYNKFLKFSTVKLYKIKSTIHSISSLFFMILSTRLYTKIKIFDSIKSRWFSNVFFKRIFNNNKKKMNLFFFYDYYFKLFNTLSSRIEWSIRLYTEIQIFFSPTIFFNNKPFIKNSKLICEYITMSLESGFSINHVWKQIKFWIENQQNFLEKIESGSLRRRILGLSRNPLKGIRIICRGPNYKARRKRKFIFHSWVSDSQITGKMPTQSFDTQIDFYQSFAIMKQASIGVRVWTLFEFIRKT